MHLLVAWCLPPITFRACVVRRCDAIVTRATIFDLKWTGTEDFTTYSFKFHEKSKRYLLTLGIVCSSKSDLRSSLSAASPLYNIAPLLVVLSFLDLPHPLYFFSHSIQTFQGARPFPLSRTELPFALPRSPSVQHHHPRKPQMRPTHGQWRHTKPHEKTSSVNSPLGMLLGMTCILSYLIHSWPGSCWCRYDK